jgi:hypothetical protein
MRIQSHDGVWERQAGLSPVAKNMVQAGDPVSKETGEVLDCFICDAQGVQRPAVCHTLLETTRPDGTEAVTAMGVCRAHRAQWKWFPFQILDGQHRGQA